MKSPVQLCLFVFWALFSWGHAAEMVPFVIPADVNAESVIRMTAAPLGPQDRLSANEHFVGADGRRVRLWGVNLSFAANFPTHADAARIAERLAAFGVNAVRCHHMDTAVWPRGIWDATGRALHPEALDRLDYFIDQLARRGIYTNLNLHVGKKHSAVLDIPESNTDYDKMVNIFTPELIAAQKEYARRLLTHKNPYRDNVPLGEDEAVAIVEITNENSLFMWDAENTLRALPAFYADILQTQYNAWLKNNYTTQKTLEQAWLDESVPLGDNMLKHSTFTQRLPEDNVWCLEQHEGCRALLAMRDYKGQRGLCMEPARTDGTSWHLQYNQRQLTFQKGQVYTVEFEAAAEQPRMITVAVGQAHEPWANLGLSQSVNLTPEWKSYRASFTASADDTNGRLNFAFGNDDTRLYLANVKLCSGVEYTLNDGESLDDGTIELFGQVDSERRRLDRMIFLAETEKAYFDEMRQFIKNDLGGGAMVTGTIVFGPLGLYAQSDMDFIDAHAYWQHPRFPNRPWDPADWLIDQKAMSANPPGTLYELAAERLAGKPFTVTEYNHPAPLDSQAECVPMIASFAAAQDWDGVWLYTYSHSNDNWDRERLNSYFDIDTNPAKWGFMPAGAVLFRDAALQPFRNGTVWSLTRERADTMDALAALQIRIDRDLAGFLRDVFATNMATRLYASFDSDRAGRLRSSGHPGVGADLVWDVVNGDGLYVMRNDRCCAVTGQTQRYDQIQRPIRVRVDTPGFAAVTVTALDEQPIAAAGRILVTACGRVENTGMQFSDDRRTVGHKWGQSPVLIEPVTGTLTLPDDGGEAVCNVLNPDGTVRRTIPVTGGVVPLKAEYGTMWYLIERQTAD